MNLEEQIRTNQAYEDGRFWTEGKAIQSHRSLRELGRFRNIQVALTGSEGSTPLFSMSIQRSLAK
jgi:hypothetical protein